MKKISGLLAALLLSTLTIVSIAAVPGAQAAKPTRMVKMAGLYETDGGAVVQWVNVVKRGKVRKVKQVRLKRLTFVCDDFSEILVSGKVKGAAKVDRSLGGAYVDAPVQRPGRDDLRFTLRFEDNRGNTGTGGVHGTIQRPDGVTCTSESPSFSIRRR